MRLESDPVFFPELITGNETLVYTHDLETNYITMIQAKSQHTLTKF